MAGGIGGKAESLVLTARAAVTSAQQAIDIAQQKGQTGTSATPAVLAELAAVVDPAIAAAITALQALT